MSSEESERVAQRLDHQLATLRRYTLRPLRKLPANVMPFPKRSFLDRAPHGTMTVKPGNVENL